MWQRKKSLTYLSVHVMHLIFPMIGLGTKRGKKKKGRGGRKDAKVSYLCGHHLGSGAACYIKPAADFL